MYPKASQSRYDIACISSVQELVDGIHDLYEAIMLTSNWNFLKLTFRGRRIRPTNSYAAGANIEAKIGLRSLLLENRRAPRGLFGYDTEPNDGF